MSYEVVDGNKVWVGGTNTPKAPKKPFVDRPHPLHEVYIKDEKGGLMKQGEVRGTRAQQVRLRREIRSRLGLTSDRILLFTNGILVKFGIDKGTS